MDNKNTKKIKTKCSKSKKTTNKCSKNNASKCSTNKILDLGLKNLSYADYVLLSSVAAYAISEDLNDTDLDLLIVFFSMLSSDLALARTKRGIFQADQAKNNIADSDTAAIVTTTTPDEALISDLSRKTKVKKKRVKIKKKK